MNTENKEGNLDNLTIFIVQVYIIIYICTIAVL